MQLFALISVPPLAFALAALARRGRPAVPALLAPALFGPLALVDPDETTLLLGLRDVAFWSLVGAVAGLALALLAGAVIVPATGRLRWRPRFAALAAVVVAAAGTVVYTTLGQPGFHGEHLFVIMKEQADLGGLRDVPDRTTRIRQTYERLVGTAERSQASLRSALRAKGLDFTPFYLVNGIEVDAGPLARQWLEGRSDVDRVLLNPHLRPLPVTPSPSLDDRSPAPAEPPWNLTLIKADQVWSQFTTGRGIVVGSSDSGVDGTHPALRASFRGADDSWLDPFGHSAVPVDTSGHGTHTLATAVGAGVGVAPGAQWVACANLPATWAAWPTTSAACSSCSRPIPPAPTPCTPACPSARPRSSPTPGAAPPSKAATPAPWSRPSTSSPPPASSSLPPPATPARPAPPSPTHPPTTPPPSPSAPSPGPRRSPPSPAAAPPPATSPNPTSWPPAPPSSPPCPAAATAP